MEGSHYPLLWCVIVIVMAIVFYNFGIVAGLSHLGLFLVVTLLCGVFLVPAPESQHYLKIIFHTLTNREADYRRDGDQLRADAAKHFADCLVEVYGGRLVDERRK
jgi:hypothetical protein